MDVVITYFCKSVTFYAFVFIKWIMGIYSFLSLLSFASSISKFWLNLLKKHTKF